MIRLRNILVISGIVIIPAFLIFFDLKFGCLFKEYLHFRCPGCGLTRSLESLINLNLGKSFYYNILTIPLVLIAIYIVFNLVIDTFNNTNRFFKKLLNFFEKYYLIIIIILLIVMIINNYHQI